MNKKLKIAPLIALLLLVILVVVANRWRSLSPVRSVRVDIDYCGADTLVTPQQVVDLVVDNEEDILRYHFEIFPNGKVALHVDARNRQSIDYTGRVNPDFDPAEKKK